MPGKKKDDAVVAEDDAKMADESGEAAAAKDTSNAKKDKDDDDENKKTDDTAGDENDDSPNAGKKQRKRVTDVAPGSLTRIELENERYPIKTIIETFLRHADSQDNDISEEIELSFKKTVDDTLQTQEIVEYPDTFRIHETFPILTMQDNTHFCSFGIDRQLYEQIKEEQLKPSGDLKFVDLSQYQLTVRKIRIQIRRVNSREIYSSYQGMEVRMIIIDAELCRQQSTEEIMGRRKNWYMKSVYRDADVRSLMQSKYHERMSVWLDAQIPEFEDWPKSSDLLNTVKRQVMKDEGYRNKLDRGINVIVQPEDDDEDKNESKALALKPKLKPEIGREMYFECIQERYDKVPGIGSQDGKVPLTPMDCEDLSILERGRAKYEEMIKNRRESEELRKLKEAGIQPMQVVHHRFNTEEERRRTQERQAMRQNRNEIKEMAEQAKISYFQLQTLGKQFAEPPKDVSSDKKSEIRLMSRRAGNAPVPPRLHLNHTKRFILWFREHVVKDPSVHKNQVEKNKHDGLEQKVPKSDDLFSNHFGDDHDFSIILLQRIKNIHAKHGQVQAIGTKRSTMPEPSRNPIEHKKEPVKPLMAKSKPKFGIQAKPSQAATQKTEKDEDGEEEDVKFSTRAGKKDEDDDQNESSQMKSKLKMGGGLGGPKGLVGIKRKMPTGGLGNSLKKSIS